MLGSFSPSHAFASPSAATIGSHIVGGRDAHATPSSHQTRRSITVDCSAPRRAFKAVTCCHDGRRKVRNSDICGDARHPFPEAGASISWLPMQDDASLQHRSRAAAPSLIPGARETGPRPAQDMHTHRDCAQSSSLNRSAEDAHDTGASPALQRRPCVGSSSPRPGASVALAPDAKNRWQRSAIRGTVYCVSGRLRSACPG